MSKVIRLRLTDAASGESRAVSVAAGSLEEAEAIVLAQEQKKVAFTLDPAEAADFERRLKVGELSGRDKARLFAHQQVKPYVIQKAKES